MFFSRFVYVKVPRLIDRLEVCIDTTDVRQDVVAVTKELTVDLIVDTAHRFVLNIVAFIRPFRKFPQHTLQIEHTVGTCLHRIIAKVFRLTTCIVSAVGFTVTKPQTRIVLEPFRRKFVEFVMVALIVISIEHRTVTPFNCPLIVVIDAGEDAGTRNAVLWLSYIVKTSIVHDAWRVTILLNEGLRAQTIYWNR
ncbi:hypothetical protein EVA_05470 [gut metagenome]|uniref:Uncharacterized protein n=1 Tax=gut metagenome TaxID=749906 RepID=J9GHB0_9ZZZZ